MVPHCARPSPSSQRGCSQAALYCAQLSHPPNPERAETRTCPRRAPLHRARSASKKGTWLRPPPPWLLQKQSHCHLLSFDSGPAEGLNDLTGQHFRHFHQGESIHHFDGTDHI